jgi:hypothetical protein
LTRIASVLLIFPNDTSPWVLQPILLPLELIPLGLYIGWTIRTISRFRQSHTAS